MTISALHDLGEQLQALVRAFDAQVCDGETAKAYVEAFGRIERLGTAGKILALGQVDRTGAWAFGAGAARSTADWLAARTGTPMGDAIRATATARQLHEVPATERALRDGVLSAQQANTITDAASQAPEAETQLLDLAARNEPLQRLRDRARQAVAAAQNDATRAERQHRLRRARRWNDEDGMRCYGIALTPEQAATFEPAWDHYTTHVFETARRDGHHEPHEALAADALVAMASASLTGSAAQSGRDAGGEPTGTAGSKTVRVHALLVVSATALRRGHTIPGETCEISGIGPIDVPAAKRLLGDATIDILVTDGIDVRTVAHTRRHPNRRQRAALLLDWECEIRGCAASRNLEIDHIEPYAETHRTEIESLGPKCRWHHPLKTHQGWRDGPRGQDGKRDLIPPDPRGDPPDPLDASEHNLAQPELRPLVDT